MTDHVTIGDVEYLRDAQGAIQQLNPKPYKYDSAYIGRTYGSIPYEKLNETAFLRLGALLARCPIPTRLLDWGYGCGAFLRAAATIPGCESYGFDINGLNPPATATFCASPLSEKWSVVTFYDVLEHIADMSFLRHLQSEMIVVTVPHCHANLRGWDWFARWKHRKPDEHVHHWDAEALMRTLQHYGWASAYIGSVEDCTRKGDDSPNILTVVASRV